MLRLTVSTVLVAACVLLQPEPGRAIQTGESGGANQNNTAEDQDGSEEPLSVVPTGEAADTDENASDYSTDNPSAEAQLVNVSQLPSIEIERDALDHRQFWLTVALFGLAVVQLWLLKRTVHETGKAAKAATISADAQIQQLRLLYEPSIELVNPTVQPMGAPHTLLLVTWTVKNVGLAPLRITHLHGYARALRPRNQTRPEWPPAEPSVQRTLGVGGELAYSVHSPNLNQTEIDRFNRHTLTLSVQIEVECPDPFDLTAGSRYFVFRRMITCGSNGNVEPRWFSRDAEDWPQPSMKPHEVLWQT